MEPGGIARKAGLDAAVAGKSDPGHDLAAEGLDQRQPFARLARQRQGTMDGAARQALERKAVAQTQLQSMDGQVKQLEDQQEKLVAAQQQLETRIESFRSQKEVLKAQYSAAEAEVRVGEAATGIGQHMQDTGLAIQRAKDKTEEMQARAPDTEPMVITGPLGAVTVTAPEVPVAV